MKKVFLSLLIAANLCSINALYGQQKITPQKLVGIWQYGSASVGDQLNQSFTFDRNGRFFFDNGQLGDDIVSTVELKGRYRLVENKMYFTIISRTIIDSAKIGVKDPQVYSGIFEYRDKSFKEIREKTPKELIDPAIITVIKPNHIKINDEDYFKVSSDPNAKL